MLVGSLIFLFVIALGIYYFRVEIFDSEHRPSKTFTQIVAERPDFASAVDIVKNGGDLAQARRLLDTELAAAEKRGEFDVAGVVKLWVALTQVTSSNDPAQLSAYTQTLTDVALNSTYDQRTRKYAYAFLGDIFSRLIAINAPQTNAILDEVLARQELSTHRKLREDGTVNYRESITEILRFVLERDNPLVSARVASFIVGGLERGEVPDGQKAARIDEALYFVQTAKQYEMDLQEPDITSLYPSYLFLRAQVYGGLSLLDEGAHRSKITEDVLSLYEQAVTAATASSNRGAEASVRYNYAKYLVGVHLFKEAPTATETKALSSKLDTIFSAFELNESLKTTAMFGIMQQYWRAGESVSQGYPTLQQMTKYSPTLKALLTAEN